jgi:flagellar FliJ protein
MGEFKFPLQRVMEMRRDKVTEVERALEERFAAKESLRSFLMAQRDLYFGERNELNTCVMRSEMSRIPVLETSLDLRKARMLEILERIKEIEADIDFLQNALVAAKREFKVVEKLREKRHAEWLAEEETRERKVLDEMATIRHQRREFAERIEESA